MDTKTDTKPDLRIYLADLVCGVHSSVKTGSATLYHLQALVRLEDRGNGGKNADQHG